MTHRRGARAVLVLVLALLASPAWAQAKREPPKALSCDRAQFRVAVDVGHTAEHPGAISARGVPEYEFNLRLAKEIWQALSDAGFEKTTLLVTEGHAKKGLVKRVADANSAAADLFLSIHHDSVPDQFLEVWEYEGKQSHYSDRFNGHSIFISNDSSERAASLQFGRLLGGQLKARGLQYTPHYTEAFMGRRQRQLVDADAGVYRFDHLVVLRTTHMPAVLLEAGSIINRDEELLMASPEHRALITAAVTDAVEAFCAARSRQRIARAARTPHARLKSAAARR